MCVPGLGLDPRISGDFHPAHQTRSDAVADSNFLFSLSWIYWLLVVMISRRTFSLLIVFLTLSFVIFACGGGASMESPPMEEPAEGPDAEEPAAEEPAMTEEPVMVISTQPAAATAVPLTPTLPGVDVGIASPAPVIQEYRRLTLEYAPSIRLGDSTRIRMTLEVDDLGNITPTAEVGGNVVTGKTVPIPNLYDTHMIMAEAQLDMAGVAMDPMGTISEPLKKGSSVTFYWTVRPPEAGKYEGTAWLHLRFVPRTSVNGEQESRTPVSAQFITLEVRSLLGLSGGTARGVGAAGSVVGAVIGFPFFDDVVRWFWRRFKR